MKYIIFKILCFFLLLLLFASCNESDEVVNSNLIDSNTLEFNIDGVKFRMKQVKAGSFCSGLQREDPSYINYIEKTKCSFWLDNEFTILGLCNVTFTYDYWIGETEVTQELWEKIMGYNHSYFKNPQNPVENINFYEIVTFFNKLNRLFNFETVYTLGNKDVWKNNRLEFEKEQPWVKTLNFRKGFRLPIDFEWEYAARGGHYSDSSEYLYSGSNNIYDIAWYSSNSNNSTHIVAQKQPNKLGVYDMTGNVAEFTNTRISSLFQYEITHFEKGDTLRHLINPLLYMYTDYSTWGSYYPVICGGSYNVDERRCFLAQRYNFNPNNKYPLTYLSKASIYGFRILLLRSNSGV